MLRILLGLVVIVLLAIGGVVFYFNEIATTAIERGGTYALGVDTHLSSFLVRPIAGSVRLGGLQVANPPGYDQPYFMTMGSGRADVALRTLREDPIVISRVELDGIGVSIERKQQGFNYDQILKNLERVSSSSTSAEAEEASAGPGVIIKELVIKNVNAHVSVSPIGGKLTKLDVKVPEIRLTNLGGSSQDGAELTEIVSDITTAVLKAIASKSSLLPPGLASDLNRHLARVGVPKISVDNEQVQKLQEQLGEHKDTADKVLKGVGGLLKRGD